MTKKEARDFVTTNKEKLTKEEIALYSKMIADRLVTTDFWNNAKTLYVYMSYNQEVLTKGLIEAALISGKQVAIPKTFDKSYMHFCFIKGFDEIEAGYCNIPEPVTTNISKEKDVLIIMPGLAFDLNKNRVGYGGGFYDKYLAEHKDVNFHKVALCFDFQLLDNLEVEEHDEKVDMIITPSKIVT